MQVEQRLGLIEKRLAILEGRLTPPAKIVSKKISPSDKAKESLPGRILALRDKGFFSKSKSSEEVHKNIQASYDCELSRVQMALFRLSTNRKLRITSGTVNGRKVKAYAW